MKKGGCFQHYCCLAQGHNTKSSDQIKLTTQAALGVSQQNESAVNILSTKHKLKLAACQRSSLRDHQILMAENYAPKLIVEDDQSQILIDQSEDVLDCWQILSSSASSINCEASEIPEEDGDKQARLTLKKQHTMHTMTYQNLKTSSAKK